MTTSVVKEVRLSLCSLMEMPTTFYCPVCERTDFVEGVLQCRHYRSGADSSPQSKVYTLVMRLATLVLFEMLLHI